MDTVNRARLAALAFCVVGGSAAAADPYFGGASGRGTLDDFAPRSGTFIDDKATSEKYFFGWEVGRRSRIEIGKVNFGDFDGPNGPLELGGTSYSLIVESRVGWNTQAFVRLGRFNWEGTDFGAAVPAEEHGNDGLWGVGLTYRLSRGIQLRGEWERYDLGPYKVDMPSLGVMIEL